MLKSIFTPRTVLKLGSSVSIYEKIKDNASNQVMKTQNTEQSALNAKISKAPSKHKSKAGTSPISFPLTLTNVRKLSQRLLAIMS